MKRIFTVASWDCFGFFWEIIKKSYPISSFISETDSEIVLPCWIKKKFAIVFFLSLKDLIESARCSCQMTFAGVVPEIWNLFLWWTVLIEKSLRAHFDLWHAAVLTSFWMTILILCIEKSVYDKKISQSTWRFRAPHNYRYQQVF